MQKNEGQLEDFPRRIFEEQYNMQIIQVFAIELVTFAVDFFPLAVE